MNKRNAKFLSTAVFLLCFSSLRAQTFTSGNLTAVTVPALVHDSTVCNTNFDLSFTITKTASFIGDSIIVKDTNSSIYYYSAVNTTGVSPWTVNALVFNQGSSDIYLPVTGGTVTFSAVPFLKVISGTDTLPLPPSPYSLYVANPCLHDNVSGKIYIDNNNDCVYNSGDVPLVGIAVLPSLTGVGSSDGTASDAVGNYTVNIQESWLVSYSLSLPSPYNFIFPPSSCASGVYSNTTVPQVNADFPVQSTNLVDLQCGAGSPGNARPNRPFYMQPYVSNIGSDTASGVLTFIKDSRVAYDAALSTNPAVVVSGDTLLWYYSDLTNVSGGAYWNSFMSDILLTPNSTVNIGDTLCFRVYTSVPATDVNPANNNYTICIPVVNSFDPNIKEVSPKGTGTYGNIPPGTPELTYTIHFQNTGTDVAYTVSVIDTLSPNVDAHSLRILGTSHNMMPEWLTPNVVKFNFSNINLADSFSNEPASHGYVSFSVALHSGLPIGTQIKNKGYIYFDSNPAVITNQALNTIGEPANVNNVKTTNIKVYPNPASDAIFVENLQDGNISILSMNGSVVLTENITNNKIEININRLPAGVYILKTVSKDGATTRKFVKQ